jgi:benzaldehyde dehydrogenase (NAD)
MTIVQEPWLKSADWDTAVYTGGGWQRVDASREVTEPATGRILTNVGLASAATVATAAKAARTAQAAWADAHYTVRAAVMLRAAAAAQEHAAEFVQWLVREAGAVQPRAEWEFGAVVAAIQEAACMPSQSQGTVLPGTSARMSIARRVPLGVVGVIAPFNFPAILAMRAVAPALALGNAVVLKPDPRTPISGGHAMAKIFEEAGLPEGLLHVLPGGGDVGEAMCSDPNIAMIQFTGSTAAGRKVGEVAGRHLKKVSLELGGKNSLIVLEDADLDIAASNAAWGAYLHQGQICMASGRILVHESVADEFAKRLTAKAQQMPCGDPAGGAVAIGPLINDVQLQHAKAIVDATVAAGATLLAGGTHDGLVYRPTVLAGVTSTMPAFREEIFGPVAVLVTFRTDDEAIALANDTEYGLSAGIISRSVGRALAIGNRLRVGMLHINDQTVADDGLNPFGGQGASGNGSSIGGPANYEEFTQWQWVTIQADATAYPM